MKVSTRISLIALLVFGALFAWAQSKILDARAGIRVEEKILMLSDRPEVTRTLALGFDNLVADLLWIRGIQYFGGNFSTLDDPEKKRGMMNLLDNLVGLDPHFTAAYQFGGFVINESMRDPEAAVNFLIDGSENNPDSWKLPFDAGFIAFYQLKDYEVAKQLFIRSAYGMPFRGLTVADANGAVAPEALELLIDGDPESPVQFEPQDAFFTLDIGEQKRVGRVSAEKQSAYDESYRLQYSSQRSDDTFIDKETAEFQGVSIHTFDPAPMTRFIRFDRFETESPDGLFTMGEVRVFGPRNPETPPYVDRMAIEMDRESGRFLAAWSQYRRYLAEALEKGDEVSAKLAQEKLFDIYTLKCLELLEIAVNKYIEDKGELPPANMKELVDEGYVQQVIQEQVAQDPNFAQEVLPVLLSKDGSPYDLLSSWDGQEPHLLLTYENEEGAEDWYLISRRNLKEEQKSAIEQLQKSVNQYREEHGEYPADLRDLQDENWFSSSEEIFRDPLGGQFILDSETGEVKAVNPKY